jgi:hypothetical protein
VTSEHHFRIAQELGGILDVLSLQRPEKSLIPKFRHNAKASAHT